MPNENNLYDTPLDQWPTDWHLLSAKLAKLKTKEDKHFWRTLVSRFITSKPIGNESEEALKDFFKQFWLTTKATLEVRNIGMFKATSLGYDIYVKNKLEQLSPAEKTELAHYKQSNDDTLLHLAVASNHLFLINTLLEHGADINAIGMYQETPLHRAALDNKYAPIVAFLLARGANYKARRYNNESTLHIAAAAGADDIADILLTKDKSQLTLVSKEARTPMFVAVLQGHVPVVAVLFKHGDSLDQFDPWINASLLSLAVQNRHSELLRYIIDNKAKIDLEAEDIKHLFNTIPEDSGRGLRKMVTLLLVHRQERDLAKLNKDNVKENPRSG